MKIFLLIPGLLIVLWGLLEALWTTVWVDGNSAPLTGRLTTGIWKLFKNFIPEPDDKLLSLSGPIILISSVVSWIFMIWLGWSLMFFSDSGSIYVRGAELIPQFSDIGWYVAYVMFTVGNGDFLPQQGFWQILSMLVSFTGMSIVTLSITYILQVISAVVNKRAFASEVLSIGRSAEEFVIKQWTGSDFGAIELQLNSLSTQLGKLNEQHLAFPILHYYHAAHAERSQDLAIAVLDDAVSIIKLGMDDKNLPPETILTATRQSVSTFLNTVKMAFINPAKDAPRIPDLNKIKKAGVPVLSNGQFESRLQEHQKRRKLILGLINNGAWEWPK